MLTLYNTLTRRKERFEPIDPANVRMYVCGPTVYDYAHIGNARPVIVFDVLFRLLRHMAKQGVWDGGKGETVVTYARNITDVDDKINARAAEEYPDLPLNEAIRKVTEKTERQFHEDIAALGVLPPTVEPRATESIPAMRALCESLVAKGHAYVAQDHVLFDVSSMPDYGRLANRSLEEMEAGARVDVAPYKKGPMDFVLWKPSKPGEPAWPSPCGIAALGRPGWHIECSAMSDTWLWENAKAHLSAAGLAHPHVFDIHGGGIDLVFPHHENEIAQSRCGFGTPLMANYWLHNGFLQVEGQKMSKSLGNFVTIRELLRDWPGDIIRLQMLKTHYRQPIDWTLHGAQVARFELESWARVVGDHYRQKNDVSPNPIVQALAEDLNTPQAITVMRELFARAKEGKLSDIDSFVACCKFLGFRKLDQPGLFEGNVSGINISGDILRFLRPVNRLRAAIANDGAEERRQEIVDEIENSGVKVDQRGGYVSLVGGSDKAASKKIGDLVAARNAARKARDFKEADRIRDELSAMGIQLKDAKDPATDEIVTTWEVKR